MAFEPTLARAARAAIVGVLLLVPATAHGAPNARDKETARALMDEGDKKFAAADYAAALKAYKAAYALVAVPTTGIAVAKTQAALGQLVEARDTALTVTRFPQEPKEPPPFKPARARADELARTLLPRIPSVQVTVTGPPAGAVIHVEIDGNALPDDAATLPAKVNPGKHAIVAWADRFSHETKEVTVAESTQVPVAITLKPEAAPSATATPSTAAGAPAGADHSGTAAPPRKSSHTLAYVGLGVGAVGIAVGSVAGVLSLSKTSSAKNHCSGNACSPEAKSDLDASLLWANVSNVGFALGVVGAAAFVVSLLTSDSGSASAAATPAKRVVPAVSLGGAGVVGAF